MHLNNEQLIEPNEAELAHLAQCAECRSRHENLESIRSRLQTLADDLPVVDQWQAIKRDYETRTNVRQLVSTRKSNHFWKTASAALAASFALFVVWQSYFMKPDTDEHSEDVRFAVLIKESNEMQRQLNMQLSTAGEINSRVISLMVELDIINTKLEKAYLQKGDPEQKMNLWQQRQVLLKATLTEIKRPQVIKI